MDLSEIRLDELDIEDLKKVGTAPLPVKIAIIVILCVALLVAGYFLDTTQQQVELDKVTAEEQQLRQVFAGKQAKAANLEAYKQQLEEMRTSFGTLLRQLPNET